MKTCEKGSNYLHFIERICARIFSDIGKQAYLETDISWKYFR